MKIETEIRERLEEAEEEYASEVNFLKDQRHAEIALQWVDCLKWVLEVKEEVK